MARTPKLPDKEKLARIVSYIRSGAYPHVAAGAEGIPSSTFFRWMKLGKQGVKSYAAFWEKVTTAHSQKRVSAEVEVGKENPLAWLRYGPGRSRPGEPGWTDIPLELSEADGKESEADELTDEERVAAIAALLDRARARAIRSSPEASAGDGGVGS
jgi:hypothetical protein